MGEKVDIMTPKAFAIIAFSHNSALSISRTVDTRQLCLSLYQNTHDPKFHFALLQSKVQMLLKQGKIKNKKQIR